MIIAVFIIQPISYFSLPYFNGVTEWIIALVHGGLGGGGCPGISTKIQRFLWDRPSLGWQVWL